MLNIQNHIFLRSYEYSGETETAKTVNDKVSNTQITFISHIMKIFSHEYIS